MSPKELLYIEDALGHEQAMQTICQDSAQRIQDPELKQLVNQLCTQHQQIFSQFYNLV
ncbi:MAG: hypothetical protein LIO46_01520 [Clostridiales bacterium]|nr:hypothetical protein [Clostridiales bacterium]